VIKGKLKLKGSSSGQTKVEKKKKKKKRKGNEVRFLFTMCLFVEKNLETILFIFTDIYCATTTTTTTTTTTNTDEIETRLRGIRGIAGGCGKNRCAN